MTYKGKQELVAAFTPYVQDDIQGRTRVGSSIYPPSSG